MKTRRMMVLAAILFLLTAAAGAAELRLRCVWTSPTDHSRLDIAFAGNPLVAMLPGETLEVSARADAVSGTVTILKDGQPYREDAVVLFTAPERPGSYYIPLDIAAGGQRREAEICVLVPHKASARKTDKGLDLFADGQEIGHYRHPARSGNRKVRGNPDSYQPPVWWMRLTDGNALFEVVPGLTAGELVVPSEDTGLKHTDLVPVHYPMWQAIHTLREELRARAIPGELRLISMFRSPSYNRGVGSNAFGRHIYGDAFDFYIGDGDGIKALDLNRDGRLDRRDAYPVVAAIEDLQADGRIPMGGIGIYNSVAGDHEVTMHLDLRGHRATWGYRYSAIGKRSEFSWHSRRFADLDRADEDIAAERAAKDGRKYVRPRREALE